MERSHVKSNINCNQLLAYCVFGGAKCEELGLPKIYFLTNFLSLHGAVGVQLWEQAVEKYEPKVAATYNAK